MSVRDLLTGRAIKAGDAGDPRASRAPGSVLDEVVLVSTGGNGSMDHYGRQLARRIGVSTLQAPMAQLSAGHFNVSPLSRAARRGLVGDRALLRRLRAAPGTPHFTHHHLARYGPALHRPYLVTAHDLIRYTDLAAADGAGSEVLINRPNLRDRRYLRRDYEGMRAAAAVIAVSDSTRRDLLERLGLAPEQVFVVHEGLDHDLFRPVSRRPIDEPYVLFVGSEQPRKNLITLLRAFARLTGDRRAGRLRLVKVGAPGDGEAPFHEPTRRAVAELGLDGRVHFAGEVPDSDLPAYYSGAECLVLPSRAEGFGFPPLEAMACGCPVVVSTAGALPEIVGDAGLQVDPDDVAGLCAALRAVRDEPALRERLRDSGLRRAAEFSWERTARQTERVYDSVRT